jgi:hypothetical protein
VITDADWAEWVREYAADILAEERAEGYADGFEACGCEA